jgi:hypothetical protein
MNQHVKIVFGINKQGNTEPIRIELPESQKLEGGLNKIVKSIPDLQTAIANQKPVSSKFDVTITLRYNKKRSKALSSE